ncbi:MAG TPA: hypothetical protein ENJ84_07775 [Gammaproteobacteria bacterium]|nr:hypothetical protein [Gammaproteobacteria bacterium]
MAISSGGGAGLDVQGIVSSLMRIERVPVNKLAAKKSDIDVKISGVGKLNNALSKLQDAAKKLRDPSKLGNFVATSSDEDVLIATAQSGEVEETHQIKINKLATNHRLASTSYTDLQQELGVGNYSFTVGDASFDVDLAVGSNTVEDLKNAINRATDNHGISASTIKTDNGYQLVLTARNAGTDNTISNLPGALGFTEITAPENAEVEVDGILLHPSSNRLTEVIPGLVLELKKTGESTVTTQANLESMADTLNEFADTYNNVQKLMKRLNTTDLKGEGISLNIESRLRSLFFSSFEDADGNSQSAFEFGLTFDKTGKLSLDETKLGKATNEDFYGMLNFFTSDTGFANAAISLSNELTESGGLLDSRKKGYNGEIDRLDRRMEQLDVRLNRTEARYLQQFSKLDGLLAQLNDTSSRLGQQLDGLAANYNR